MRVDALIETLERLKSEGHIDGDSHLISQGGSGELEFVTTVPGLVYLRADADD